MNVLPYTKYHGCGNDFVIVHENWIDPSKIDASWIEAICDRHTGIGADGFIIVKEHPLEMIYYNQDGSRAPMCGNGIRCFSQFCLDEHIIDTPSFSVQTLAGEKVVYVQDDGRFQVDLGLPDLEPAKCALKAPIWNYDYKGLRLYTLFMSTIHTVVFVDDAFMDIEKIGQEICESSLFPEQTNVNFVQIVDDRHLRVQTYERGCGVTLACGTGVCASAYVAYQEKGCLNKLNVTMKKGSLDIEFDENRRVWMRGPAVKIAKGEYYES